MVVRVGSGVERTVISFGFLVPGGLVSYVIRGYAPRAFHLGQMRVTSLRTLVQAD